MTLERDFKEMTRAQIVRIRVRSAGVVLRGSLNPEELARLGWSCARCRLGVSKGCNLQHKIKTPNLGTVLSEEPPVEPPPSLQLYRTAPSTLYPASVSPVPVTTSSTTDLFASTNKECEPQGTKRKAGTFTSEENNQFEILFKVALEDRKRYSQIQESQSKLGLIDAKEEEELKRLDKLLLLEEEKFRAEYEKRGKEMRDDVASKKQDTAEKISRERRELLSQETELQKALVDTRKRAKQLCLSWSE
jgi:hypothetical protein